MTLYAPTDVQSIFLPDGCGNPHLIDDADRLVLNCGDCEKALGNHKHLGWAATVDNVTPTCDERLQAERDEASAQKAGIARLNAYANGVGGNDPSMAALLAALTEQNNKLMEQIAAMTATQTVKSDAPTEPVAAAAAVEPPTPVDDATPVELATKKRGGRPPKSAKAE